MSLPPSYRAFLGVSNGAWAQAGWGVAGLPDPVQGSQPEQAFGFLDAARVGWFRDREPEYVEIWGYTDYGGFEDEVPHYGFRRHVPERDYLDHEREQDCIHAKAGHVRYALQVSGDVDGYTILLNPLVVDQHGEWEAWDFGSKLPGANRYRSFASLIAADVERLEGEVARPPYGLEEAQATFGDETRPVLERARAAALMAWHGERDLALELLLAVLADRSAEIDARQAAAGALGYVDDPRATAALVAASGDAEPRLQAALLPPLAASGDPDARRTALSILTAPAVEDWVIRATWPASGDTLWQAWRVTGDPRLVVQLAYCGDRRACEPLAEAIVDPRVELDHRTWMIQYAWWPHDASVAPALVAAAELDDTWLLPVGEALMRLGAEDDAVAVLVRVLRDGDPTGQAASHLASLKWPDARQTLLGVLTDTPTPGLVRALGSYGDSEVVRTLCLSARTQELRIAALDALEKIGGPDGCDALWELAGDADLLAARALARLGDERALAALLAALASEDAEIAFEGADGLRDLRSPAAASALLAAVERGADDDVAACAAHALVSMRASELEMALDVLERSPSASLRRLAELWR